MAVFLILLLYQTKALCPDDCLGKLCNDSCYSACKISCEDECSPGCPFSFISNNICDQECMNELCRFDLNDCESRVLTTVSIANSTQIAEKTVVVLDNYGKIAGVGLGVFLIIIGLILGVLLCIIGTSTPVFFVFLIIGILIPLITFFIVAFAPLHKDQAVKTDKRTDTFVAARIVFLIFMILFALLSLLKVVEYYLGINLKAKGVNSNISAITSSDITGSNVNASGNIELNPLSSGGLAQPLPNPQNSSLNPVNANPLLPMQNPQPNPLVGQLNNPLNPQINQPQNLLLNRGNPLSSNK